MFPIVGGLSVLALAGAILLKYNGLKKNNTPDIETGNNIIRIIGDVVEVLKDKNLQKKQKI
ncbi:MAG: hypothetical protein WKF36_03850 [Candidatus Nitrosocosmicus sp.]